MIVQIGSKGETSMNILECRRSLRQFELRIHFGEHGEECLVVHSVKKKKTGGLGKFLTSLPSQMKLEKNLFYSF